MSKIIVVANQKGGAGKTTVSMQLGGGFAQVGKKTLIIDADPQGTALRWCATAPDTLPFPTTVINLSAAGEKIHREIKNFINDYEIIIIDCPPAADSNIAQSALLVADLCIIPIVPSPPDIWASVAIKEVLSRAIVINEDLNARILVNQLQPNVSLTKDILPLLEHFKIPLFATQWKQRVAYKESAAVGNSVHALGARGHQATCEVDTLVQEIQKIL
jgi:chromosome partitioning protein